MKEFFISECCQQENKVVTSSFVVASKQVKAKKNGEPYLALTLADRTGQIEAKMWDNVEEFILAFEQDDFLKIKGLINRYKNRYQLTIHKLRRMEEGEIDFTDYLPKTTKDIGELWRTLTEFVATFQNPHLKSLVELFMAEAEIAERYRNAPALLVFKPFIPHLAQDHQGHRRTLANAHGVCGHVPEPAPEVAGGTIHGGRGNCRTLPQCSRGQDPSSGLHRRIARSRRVAVALLRSSVPELSTSQ